MAGLFRRDSADVVLASGLAEMQDQTPETQETFWKSLATKLQGHPRSTNRRWYSTTVAQCVDSHYDALGRYFDATPPGLAYIYRKKAKPEGMDEKGFRDALEDHYGFNEESDCKVTLEALREVCDKARGADGLISLESFAEVMRKLRIAMLLESLCPVSGNRDFAPDIGTAVYHSVYCDETWNLKIMEYDTTNDQAHMYQMMDLVNKFHLDRHDDIKTEFQRITEFLFDSPHSLHNQDTGKVQWVHVHQPNTSLVLALGQQFHLRLSVMGILCRINEVPPQMNHCAERKGWGSSAWSSVVFPCVFLDKRSKKHLLLHRAWCKAQEQQAREDSSNANTRRRAAAFKEKRRRTKKIGDYDDDDEEPHLFVGVVKVTQVLLWSGTSSSSSAESAEPTPRRSSSDGHHPSTFQQPGHTVVTCLGTPSYLGYWVFGSGTWSEKSFKSRLLALLPCNRRYRDQEHPSETPPKQKRQGPDGYTEISQTDDDLESCSTHTTDRTGDLSARRSAARTPRQNSAALSAELRTLSNEEVEEMKQNSGSKFSLLQYQQLAEESSNFEIFYDDVLRQLKKKHSVVRMGTNLHLLIRIILDGTSEFLDVLELYQIVINKVQNRLAEPHSYKDGPDLMSMISLSKMELTSILRSVEGFQIEVLPKLVPLGDSGVQAHATLSERMVNHHLIDINHNVVQAVRECHSQIHICESLIEDWDRKTADKANNILNILTFITFLMVPMQLMTGYYGMNFVHGLPELQTRQGPRIFWGIVTICTFLMALLMIALNRAY